jgi:hypothetical protein
MITSSSLPKRCKKLRHIEVDIDQVDATREHEKTWFLTRVKNHEQRFGMLPRWRATVLAQ